MRQKMVVFAVIFILSTCLAGCSIYGIKNQPSIESSIETSASTAEDAKEEESDIPGNTSKPFIGRKVLDSETERFFMEHGALKNCKGLQIPIMMRLNIQQGRKL